MLLASLVGITLGVLSARRPGGWFDRLVARRGVSRHSFPVYWVGLLLILLFAVDAAMASAIGLRRPALPRSCPRSRSASRSIAFLARMTRSAMLEVLGSDFVRTARAKGLRERAVRRAPRAAQRAHPGDHRARARLRRTTSPAASSPRRSSAGRASAATSSTRSRGATFRRSRARCSSSAWCSCS